MWEQKGSAKAHWGLKQRGSISSALEDSQKARASLAWAGSPLLLSVFLYSQLPGVTKLCFPGASAQIRSPRLAVLRSEGSAAGRLLETPISLRQRRKKERATLPAFGPDPPQLLHTAFLCHLVTDKHQAYFKKGKKKPDPAGWGKNPRACSVPGGKAWAEGDGWSERRAGNQQHKGYMEVLVVKTRAAAPLDHLHKHSCR